MTSYVKGVLEQLTDVALDMESERCNDEQTRVFRRDEHWTLVGIFHGNHITVELVVAAKE